LPNYSQFQTCKGCAALCASQCLAG
jgi:hypothetical protein